MPQFLEKDPDTGEDVYVERPAPLDDNVVNTYDEDGNAVTYSQPRGEKIEDFDPHAKKKKH